jgi:hypothetical protein
MKSLPEDSLYSTAVVDTYNILPLLQRERAPRMRWKFSPTLAKCLEARRFSIKVIDTLPVQAPIGPRETWMERMVTESWVELRALFRSSLSCMGVLVSYVPSRLIRRRRGRKARVVLVCCLLGATGGAERTAGAAARAERVRAARN